MCAMTVTMTIAGASGAHAQTFENGMAQPVFSSNPADWIAGEVWVDTGVDDTGPQPCLDPVVDSGMSDASDQDTGPMPCLVPPLDGGD